MNLKQNQTMVHTQRDDVGTKMIYFVAQSIQIATVILTFYNELYNEKKMQLTCI